MQKNYGWQELKILENFDISQMNFNDRRFYSANGVMQSDGCMCECTRIEYHCRRVDVCVMQPVDQLAFMIGLAKHCGKPQIPGMGITGLFDVAERQGAIDLRLPRAEEIEIWSVEDVNGFAHGLALKPQGELRGE